MKPLPLLAWFCLAFAAAVAAQEAGADRLSKLLFAHAVEVAEAEKPYREDMAQLNANYIKALNRTAESVQKAGQLEQLLAIRNEIANVEETGAPGEKPFPGFKEMRQKYGDAAERFRERNRSTVSIVEERHLEELADLKVDLTKAGDIETALEVSAHIGTLAAKLAGEEQPPPPPLAGEVSVRYASNTITETPLFAEKFTAAELTLEPGIYEIPGKITIGDDDQEDREDKFGYVTVPKGTTMRDGEIFVNNGSFTAEGALFVDVDLNADLSAEVVATDCVFDGGKLRKGGGWSVKYYSAKFVLENCVMNGCFPEPMRPRAIGVKITHSTIIGATITPGEYYETPVEESDSEWRQVEQCHFIDCRIPASFLLMTEDCVFENCEFIEDIEDLPVEKSKTVRMYFRNSPVAPPSDSRRITFKGEDAIAMRKPFGSKISYEFPVTGNP